METQKIQPDNSPAMAYGKSLRDAVKRRYAVDYLSWVRAGRIGSPPHRGALPLELWKLVSTNLEALV